MLKLEETEKERCCLFDLMRDEEEEMPELQEEEVEVQEAELLKMRCASVSM